METVTDANQSVTTKAKKAIARSDYTSLFDISVIVPVYNAEPYIRQCIQSLLDQTKDRIEIVVVNDGSTDKTPEIVREMVDKNDNIRMISKSNGGLKTARIAGLKEARGKYIGWLDADDFVKPQMYEILFCAAEENDAELVYCDYDFYPPGSEGRAKWYQPYVGKKDWRYLDKNTQFWNKLFLRDLLERVQLIEVIDQFEEYAPILPMMEARNVVSIDQKLHYYRVGHNSMSGRSFIGKVNHYMDGVKVSARLKDMIAGKEYQNDLDEYFDYRYIYTLIMLMIVAAKNKDKRTYEYACSKMREIHYRQNGYLRGILTGYYGRIKCFTMINVLPQNYYVAVAITKIAL